MQHDGIAALEGNVSGSIRFVPRPGCLTSLEVLASNSRLPATSDRKRQVRKQSKWMNSKFH
jgi:hypothetical protein